MLKKITLTVATVFALVACGQHDGATQTSASAMESNVSGSLIDRINQKGTITVGTEAHLRAIQLP